jgi:putative transposase
VFTFLAQPGFSRLILLNVGAITCWLKRINPRGWPFLYVKQRRPFHIQAVAILPDHLHCIWTLPPGEADFSTRWNLLKGHFSRAVVKDERNSKSRGKRRERGLWQRRFRAHWITDQDDFNRHVDYIHGNPVKHGCVRRVVDWPHSSFHKFVERGIYPATWGYSGELIAYAGE